MAYNTYWLNKGRKVVRKSGRREEGKKEGKEGATEGGLECYRDKIKSDRWHRDEKKCSFGKSYSWKISIVPNIGF